MKAVGNHDDPTGFMFDNYRDPTSFGQKQLPTGEWRLFTRDADQSDFPNFDITRTDKERGFILEVQKVTKRTFYVSNRQTILPTIVSLSDFLYN